MNNPQPIAPVVYEGQFGPYTIDDSDRRGVLIYRAGLMIAALSFAVGTKLVLSQDLAPDSLRWLTPLYTLFCAALGVSLLTIHIYMAALHRVLQGFWLVGVIASLVAAHADPEPFALTVYQNPIALVGVGFLFAALTGIFFKEAFCFNRLETKLLTPLVPFLMLGHLVHGLPIATEQVLLGAWAVLLMVFAIRKTFQVIPADIGDKSVFEYLKQQSNPQSLEELPNSPSS
ncbi:MAG: DUF2301 domain-containing membrane protein [Leptolyngbyaceae cyanobacterium bins.59]|nr:DUF2301 domain-containing membrane protein [Leptolyngbyaceae cyanobacterium bins.59]